MPPSSLMVDFTPSSSASSWARFQAHRAGPRTHKCSLWCNGPTPRLLHGPCCFPCQQWRTSSGSSLTQPPTNVSFSQGPTTTAGFERPAFRNGVYPNENPSCLARQRDKHCSRRCCRFPTCSDTSTVLGENSGGSRSTNPPGCLDAHYCSVKKAVLDKPRKAPIPYAVIGQSGLCLGFLPMLAPLDDGNSTGAWSL